MNKKNNFFKKLVKAKNKQGLEDKNKTHHRNRQGCREEADIHVRL